MSTFFSIINKRSFHFSHCLSKNHYEVLGVSEKATQTEIKSAYYKLSMIYHPDKNVGKNEAADKFRAISAAYEVIGNPKLKKMYDRGLLSNLHGSEKTSQTVYENMSGGSTKPTYSGRTDAYDFDQWTRAHYAQTFIRRTQSKSRHDELKKSRYKEEIKSAEGLENVIILLLLSVFGIFLWPANMESLDEIRKKDSSNSSE